MGVEWFAPDRHRGAIDAGNYGRVRPVAKGTPTNQKIARSGLEEKAAEPNSSDKY